MTFAITAKQAEAQNLLGLPATHCMMFGGSRSGKTFIAIRSIVIRALAAPNSRHAVLRFRFNHVKVSVIRDTFPRVMELCYPDVTYKIDKTDWFAHLPNGSQVWFGGLDDKERTEKILGQEYATIFLNECSQITWSSRNLAVTRLAQNCYYEVDGEKKQLRLKMYYDCNPPSQAHWAYKVFVRKQDPDTKRQLADVNDYVAIQMNPGDNLENLPAGYLKTLEGLPARLRKRFLKGEFQDISDNALFTSEMIDRWRDFPNELPEMQRMIVSVDPSGSGDEDNASNDEIGITVGGLGVDGNAYLLEDLTLKTGPAKWGKVATSAFDRHMADKIVAEKNFGGAMVKHVIQTARPNTPVKLVNASRGKTVRAEPISALVEQGKIRFAGEFTKLEDELCSFSTTGYTGEDSPNRADSFIWLMTELFPGVIQHVDEPEQKQEPRYIDYSPAAGWMSG